MFANLIGRGSGSSKLNRSRLTGPNGIVRSRKLYTCVDTDFRERRRSVIYPFLLSLLFESIVPSYFIRTTETLTLQMSGNNEIQKMRSKCSEPQKTQYFGRRVAEWMPRTRNSVEFYALAALNQTSSALINIIYDKNDQCLCMENACVYCINISLSHHGLMAIVGRKFKSIAIKVCEWNGVFMHTYRPSQYIQCKQLLLVLRSSIASVIGYQCFVWSVTKWNDAFYTLYYTVYYFRTNGLNIILIIDKLVQKKHDVRIQR